MVNYGGGRDFNPQAESREMRVENDACGRSEIEKMNAAGRDLISWIKVNGLRWLDLYFNFPDRGT